MNKRLGLRSLYAVTLLFVSIASASRVMLLNDADSNVAWKAIYSRLLNSSLESPIVHEEPNTALEAILHESKVSSPAVQALLRSEASLRESIFAMQAYAEKKDEEGDNSLDLIAQGDADLTVLSPEKLVRLDSSVSRAIDAEAFLVDSAKAGSAAYKPAAENESDLRSSMVCEAIPLATGSLTKTLKSETGKPTCVSRNSFANDIESQSLVSPSESFFKASKGQKKLINDSSPHKSWRVPKESSAPRTTSDSVVAKKNRPSQSKELIKKAKNLSGKKLESRCGGRNELHRAILNDDREEVNKLVCNESLLNASASDGSTPLHCAAATNNLAMCTLLVHNGADLMAENESGFTPLDDAVSEKTVNLQVVEYLIRKEACDEKNYASVVNRPRTAFKNTLLHIAAKKGHLDLVRFLIKNYRDINVNLINISGMSAAHLAASKSSERPSAILRVLIRAGADMIDGRRAPRVIDYLEFITPSIIDQVVRYFKRRKLFLNCLAMDENDNENEMFEVAAEFLDLPVLESFKIRWMPELKNCGKNLCKEACKINDIDGITWLLTEEIVAIESLPAETQKEIFFLAVDNGHDALVNRCLDAGAKPTYELAIRAARKGFDTIATQFAVYLYHKRNHPSSLHPLLFK